MVVHLTLVAQSHTAGPQGPHASARVGGSANGLSPASSTSSTFTSTAIDCPVVMLNPGLGCPITLSKGLMLTPCVVTEMKVLLSVEKMSSRNLVMRNSCADGDSTAFPVKMTSFSGNPASNW